MRGGQLTLPRKKKAANEPLGRLECGINKWRTAESVGSGDERTYTLPACRDVDRPREGGMPTAAGGMSAANPTQERPTRRDTEEV